MKSIFAIFGVIALLAAWITVEPVLMKAVNSPAGKALSSWIKSASK